MFVVIHLSDTKINLKKKCEAYAMTGCLYLIGVKIPERRIGNSGTQSLGAQFFTWLT